MLKKPRVPKMASSIGIKKAPKGSAPLRKFNPKDLLEGRDLPKDTKCILGLSKGPSPALIEEKLKVKTRSMLKKEKEEEIQLIEDIREQIGQNSSTFLEQLKADEARNNFIQSQQ